MGQILARGEGLTSTSSSSYKIPKKALIRIDGTSSSPRQAGVHFLRKIIRLRKMVAYLGPMVADPGKDLIIIGLEITIVSFFKPGTILIVPPTATLSLAAVSVLKG